MATDAISPFDVAVIDADQPNNPRTAEVPRR